MEAELLEKFRAYLVSHHPELILASQQDYPLSRFIRERMTEVMPTMKFLQDQGKPVHEIIDRCMEELTRELRPSKADYLREVIETEYPREHHILSNDGTLTVNVVKLIQVCSGVFEVFGFSEHNKDNHLLRHAVVAEVHNYLSGLGI